MNWDEKIAEMLEEAGKYETCMSLYVCEDSDSVELCLDTQRDVTSEWIPGEGADIHLLRCRDTGKILGVRLPLYNKRLCVDYAGPLRINSSFKKDECHCRQDCLEVCKGGCGCGYCISAYGDSLGDR